MVTQSPGPFEISSDNRLTGEILYIATSPAFNSHWYGKPLLSFIQISDLNGNVLLIKENFLTFTERERDERIFIDEFAFNETSLKVESFVFVSKDDVRPFSPVSTFTVTDSTVIITPVVKPIDGKPTIISKMVGGLMLLITASLLTSKR